jgi:hypothetical protein
MRPIPTPTQDQLTAIGKKLDGDRPRECKSGDKIWHGGQCVTYYSGFDPMCRWHMKDDPAKATGEGEPLKVELMICDHAKECKHSDSCSRKKPHSKKIGCSGTNETQYPSDCKFIGQARCVPYVKAKPPITQAGKNAGHTDCTGCKRAIFNKHYRDMESWMDVCAANQLDEECLDCFDDPRDERKNYTPQPPKGEDAIKDNAQKYWENVYLHCQKLGMQPKTGLTGEQDVCAFIRDLHARAGEERFNIPEIRGYLTGCLMLQSIGGEYTTRTERNQSLREAISDINDPQDGIKAVTERGGKEEGK